MSIALSLDKYRAKIVLRILYPGSGQDAPKMLGRAIKLLRQHKLGVDSIHAFIDKIISQLQKIYEASSGEGLALAHLSVAILFLTQLKSQV